MQQLHQVESHDRRPVHAHEARWVEPALGALLDAVLDRVGRKAVRLLNTILQPRLAKDPERVAAWRSAKRVRPTTAVTVSDGAASAPSTIKVA
jgi:hypothetical protein